MTEDDASLIVDWMVRQYGFDRTEVESWVQNLHFNWPLIVKALDENGDVMGLLNMSDYRIEEETPELKNNYDFIFIPVLHRLKTHQYWQRWGAKEFYRDEDCVDYKLDI